LVLGRSSHIVLDLTPWKLVLVIFLIVFSIAIYRRTVPPLSRGRRSLLAFVRACALALLALLLLDPDIVTRRTETRRPLVLALLDVSRSMGLKGAAGAARLTDALEAASRFRSALHAADARFEVVPFSSSLAAAPLARDSVPQATGEGTDVWGALEAAQRRYRSESLRAILLLSDGRVTRGMVTVGDRISVPVYTVGFGDTLGGADVSVDDVSADRVGYRGMKMPVEALVRARGFTGRTIGLRLLEDGAVRSSTTLTVRTDPAALAVSFDYIPEKEGEHRLTVEAEPLSGERVTENNGESIRVHVFKDRIRILYIDQFADWNMDFVRDLTARSKRFEIVTVGWTPDRGYVVLPGGAAWSAPSTPAGFGANDLIIVSDDARLFSTRAAADALVGYVTAGGSLLILADENSPAARSASFDLLQAALPVRRVRSPRIEFGDYSVEVAPEGAGEAIAAALTEDAKLDAMPPLPARIAGLEPAAGARVPFVLRSGGERSSFLVVDRRGEGLSAIVLGFPLWRWKLAGVEGERTYDSFVGGLIQYLAEGARAPGLRIDADRAVYRTGDPIGLSVFIGGSRIPGAVRGEVRRKSGSARPLIGTVLFEPDSRRAGFFRARLSPLPPGEYTITASAADGGAVSENVDIGVVQASVELLDPSRNDALLTQIAEATGGAYVRTAALPSVVPRLNLREERIEHDDVREFRQNLFVFIAIVMCFALEWILRKAWGLV
jgi:hypothetical protein